MRLSDRGGPEHPLNYIEIIFARGLISIIKEREAMKNKLMAAMLVLLLSFSASAYDKQAVHVRTSELDSTPMTAGPLRLTITKFRGSVLKIGPGQITIKVENPSAEFATFSPHRLTLVDKDNMQVDIVSRILGGENNIAIREKKVAPGASIEDHYQLDRKVKLPARLYYDEKLLAEIIE